MPTIPLELAATGTPAQNVSVFGVGSRTSFTLATGGTVLLDKNLAGTEVYIYEAVTDRSSASKKITVPSPGGAGGQVTAASHQNGDLSILWRTANRLDLWYRKWNRGSNTLSAWEKVLATVASPRSIESVDIDVSATDAVAVAFTHFIPASNSSVSLLYTKATTGGAWVQSYNVTVSTASAPSRGGDSASVCWLNTESGSVRNLVMAYGHSRSGSDIGVRIITHQINESTGASAGTGAVLRTTMAAGEADPSSAATTRRLVSLYRRYDYDDFFVAISHTGVNRLMLVANLSWDGSNYVPGAPMTKASTYSIADTNAQALGHSSDGRNVNFYSAVNGNRVVVYVARYGGGWAWQGDFEYFYNEANIVTIGSGGKKNLMQTGAVRQHSRHDISVMTAKVVTGTTNSYRSTAVFAGFLTSGIVGLSPSNGSSIQTTNPDLIARVNIGLRRGQGRYKVYFQFATDDQFSQASSKSYTQPDEKYTIVDGTQDQGPDTYINIGDTLPDEITLTGPTWYYRANLIDEWGNFGPYSAVNNFFIGHAPLAITKSYNGGRTYFAEGTDFQGFNWEFTDPSPTDYQTAFQWRLCTSNGQVIYDTGKVLSVNENINYPAASGNKDTVLYWEVKVWDSEDTPGVWSDKAFFTLTDPAEVTIDSPSFGTAVTTGVPTFVFTMSTGGTRTIKEYTITVSQNGITLWNSRIGGPWPSGTQISRKFPPNILKNNQPYTVTVSIVDSVNLFATDVSSFRTEWVPPSAPDDLDVNIGLYNSEDDGYIFVTWSDDARDPDFSSWGIYRKDDLIDPNTNEVLEPGSFKLMFMEYETKANYEFRDFFAPAGYRVTYLVRQYITRDGHDMDSGDSNAISHVPTSDGYWLIEPNSDNTDADAFKLSTVTSDDFSEGREQEEMIVIGRGRRFSVGESLGMAGSLTAQIRDSPGNSARQKRMRLKQIQDTDSQLWLRNPFGDTFRVNVGNMEISRIAGVGRSEFVDVTIPYAEVGK